MGIYDIKPAFQRALEPLERFLVLRRVHPDYLTGAALLLSIGGGVALAFSGRVPWLLLLIPVVAFGRTALNALDGLVAKKTGLARPWGEVLNEFGDRLSDVALFAGLSVAPGVSFILGMTATVLMLLSSYLGTVAKAAGGQRQYGGIMGKADRMILLAGASVVAFFFGIWVMNYFLALVLVGVPVTILQRLLKTYRDLYK